MGKGVATMFRSKAFEFAGWDHDGFTDPDGHDSDTLIARLAGRLYVEMVHAWYSTDLGVQCGDIELPDDEADDDEEETEDDDGSQSDGS